MQTRCLHINTTTLRYIIHKDDEKMCRNAGIRHIFEVNAEGGNKIKNKKIDFDFDVVRYIGLLIQ
jgi:hypothetical protein